MGKTGLQLIITELNTDGEHPTEFAEIQIFVDDEEDTAHNKINALLEKRRVMMYLGWNREVYPKFKVKPVKILKR